MSACAKYFRHTAPDIRFTDLVHGIVDSSKGVSASDVKRKLERKGYDLSEYANPLALIHQTLKRLERSGRITKWDGKS